MPNLDRSVPIDDRLTALAVPGSGAKSQESAGSRLSAKERIEVLQQRLAAARNPELAREIIAGARTALEKAGQSGAQYSFREALGLEAVVQTVDRPSLNIQDGFVNMATPEAEAFGFKIRKMERQIREVIAAVGRINVPAGRTLAGTVIHISEGRVATNRHVLEEIAVQAKDGSWSLRWPNATKVDFAGEAGLASEPGFKVVGVRFHGPDPINRQINFSRLDLAILDIEPIDGAVWPSTVKLDGDSRELAPERWAFAVGYPGRPKLWKARGAPLPGYEIASIIQDTFSDDFECKKFAPGQVLQAPGTLVGDEMDKRVFAHDCSTLRGNSGSAIVEFTRDGGRVLGIHFGGLARSSNWGHACAGIRETMMANGATYTL